MTQPGGTPEEYTRRKYESEVYAEVAGTNAGKLRWSGDWHDPARVAGDYSTKSAEMYARRVASEGGGYRKGLPASVVHYHGMSHERLRAMVHDGTSAEEIDEQGIVVNDLGNVFKELASTIGQAISKEQAGWQGKGADAAFQGLGSLSNWFDSSGDATFLTANRYSQTSAAIANAQHSMPEPAGRTVTQSMDLAHQQLTRGDLGGLLNTYQNMQAQAELAAQAQQQAAAVLAARDQTFYQTGSTQPTYSPPPAPATPASATPATSPTSGSAGSPAGGSVGSPSAAIPALGHTTAASYTSPPAPTGGGGPVPAIGSLPTAGPQDGTVSGSSPVGGPPISSGGDVAGRRRTPGSTLNPGQDSVLLSPVGGRRPGGDIERGGSDRSGGSSGRAGGRAPAGGTEQEPTGGKKSGTAEPGAKAAAQAAREGTAGKTGRPGASGVPGAAAGSKKAEEDKAHKRPGFLVETDPYDALGVTIETDEHGNKIAPPVLGE
ncbi:hypothetical protein [Amycolatopsis taiwanensis]|uniref:hypothetical protein n=1 Tax=Amycolatopsis taiwanensis TaxID=342230 RepID=UPI000483D879|nr:hypothetical protein [Amycolatopsis taiwanensis]